MTSSVTRPVRVFISYRHANHRIVDKLRQYLGWLENSLRIKVFDDTKIVAGDDWDKVIRRELGRADLIVLVVSAAFMQSSYCTQIELRQALSLRSDKKVRVIPILAEDYDLKDTPLHGVATLPKDRANNLKALNKWGRNQDSALRKIVDHVKANIEIICSSGKEEDPIDAIEILNEPVDVRLEAIKPFPKKPVAGALWGNKSAWESATFGEIGEFNDSYVIGAQVAKAALRNSDAHAEVKALMRRISVEESWRDDPIGVREVRFTTESFVIQNAGSSTVIVDMADTLQSFQTLELKRALQERLPEDEPLLAPRRDAVEVSTRVLGATRYLLPQGKAQLSIEVALRIVDRCDFSDSELYPRTDPDVSRGVLS